jgi:hypothetical protein
MEARFCGSCGKPIESPPAPAPAPAIATAPLGAPTASAAPPLAPPTPEPAPPAATEAPSVSAPQQAPAAVRNANRTMIGVMMPPGGLPPAQPQTAPAQAPPAQAPAAQPPAQSGQGNPAKVANASRTMIGVMMPAGGLPAPTAPATPPSAAAAQHAPAKVANANQTMVGVTMQASAQQAIAAQQAQPSPIAMPPAAAVAPAPFAASAGSAAPASAAGTPVQGVSKTDTNNQPGLYSPTASPRSKTIPLGYVPQGGDEPISIPGIPSQKKSQRSLGPVIALTVVAALVGGGVLLALNMRAKPPAPLAAQFEAGADGARLLAVRIPDVQTGTLRFESQEVAIRDGVARLPGAVVGDRVGKVSLPVQVVPSNGRPSARIAEVVIGYVVRPELDGLGQNPPAARLAFRVAPGSRLELDGHPVPTDAEGRGIAAIADLHALPQGESSLAHSFAIRVQSADGTRVEGTYRFELPRTALTVERPARAALKTASERAVIRVRAPGASAVVIDGQPATREGDVYSAAVPTPASATRTVEVRAFRAQFAPALASVELERLTSDAQGVARFGATDSSVCAESLDNVKLSVRGSVIGAPRTFNGGATFQLVAQDRRCPRASVALWIDAEPDVTVREGETLRITGTITGSRTAVTSNGERRTDRVLHAAIVQR